jgi:hypothetical protein
VVLGGGADEDEGEAAIDVEDEGDTLQSEDTLENYGLTKRTNSLLLGVPDT